VQSVYDHLACEFWPGLIKLYFAILLHNLKLDLTGSTYYYQSTKTWMLNFFVIQKIKIEMAFKLHLIPLLFVTHRIHLPLDKRTGFFSKRSFT
jgi:hypothetical protein